MRVGDAKCFSGKTPRDALASRCGASEVAGMADNKEIVRILIVDDVEANRFMLRDIIKNMGYQPILTENGVQAVKMAERFHPQLIISDIAMPEMDGYELCQIIKGNAQLRDIPIIFISAFDDPADVVKGFNMGGEDYITKPFIPEVVQARVNVHLKLSNANRSMQQINRQLKTSVNEQLRQMEMEKKNVLHALVRVAKENVAYRGDFMERLCEDSKTLAEAMQLSAAYGNRISDTFIDTIALVVPLCDIGNVAIPTEILLKGDDLTPEEYAVMETHPSIGADILRDIKITGDYNDFLQTAIDIASDHHENWDGSGYPAGKKGDEIPLSAQIVGTVRDYCLFTSDLAEGPALSAEGAVEKMQGETRSRYNPDILDILVRIYRQLR